MNTSVKAVVEACTRGSDENLMTFPEVVGKLAEAGVERYHADLQRAEKTYFLQNGESTVVEARRVRGEAAVEFSAAGVDAAVRAIQAGAITYAEFCERIVAAGCVGYIASLAGARVVYFGRTAEVHVERFPSPASR